MIIPTGLVDRWMKSEVLEVEPAEEWRFMFEKAWRLQKEHFWSPQVGNVDWEAVLKRYLLLVGPVGTTAELMDVIFEMQG